MIRQTRRVQNDIIQTSIHRIKSDVHTAFKGIESFIDFIETRMKAAPMAKEYGAEEEELRKRIAEARMEYQKLLHEARK